MAIRSYKPRNINNSIEDLKDDAEYTITDIVKHEYTNNFKYILKIKENKEGSNAQIYKIMQLFGTMLEQCIF